MAEEEIQETGPLLADDREDDVDSALGLAASDADSLRSSILKYRQENGRTYHAYKDGSYLIPNDDMESDRLDLQHALFLLTFDGKLNCAPLPKSIHRAFDAGCGTGIWAVDFADEHPECEVVGVDLSPIQPQAVPPNCAFFVDDLEDPWTFSTKFDFIYARFLAGSIADWPKFFKQSFEFLKPGGVIELLDISYPIECDDGTLTKNTDLYKWSQLMMTAFEAAGRSVTVATKYKEQLLEAGFVNVHVKKEKWPMNPWPRDQKYKQMGYWNYENMMQALSAFSLAIFTRPKGEGGLGWSVEETQVLLVGVRRDMKDRGIHSYWPIWSIYATKPEAEKAAE